MLNYEDRLRGNTFTPIHRDSGQNRGGTTCARLIAERWGVSASTIRKHFKPKRKNMYSRVNVTPLENVPQAYFYTYPDVLQQLARLLFDNTGRKLPFIQKLPASVIAEAKAAMRPEDRQLSLSF